MEVTVDPQEELKVIYAKLNRLEQLKTDIMRLASHDLRSSIGLVNGYLQLIRLDVYPHLAPHEREYVDDLTKAVQRMHVILGDIFSLENIYKIADKPLFDSVDLADIARRAGETYLENAEAHGISLIMEIALVNSGFMVMGDAAQLSQAIGNLLSNALRYTPQNGKILIQLYQDGGYAVLEVRDSGIGVSDQDQGKLFKPFYRIKSKERDEAKGLGLGLHLVKNIIDRHQGELIFRTTPGEGSTFGFKLLL